MKLLRPFVGSLMGLACVSAAAVMVTRLNFRGLAGAPLTVRAVAHEWWWEFDYPSLGIKTNDVLYVPSATNVTLELVSADVIHSFWMAGMTKSVEILPGEMRPLDLVVESPGELYGNCDSGCGCGSVCMRFRVLARSPADFERWAARERLRRPDLNTPRTPGIPACALNGGHGRHARRDRPAHRLQRLLDAGTTRPHRASKVNRTSGPVGARSRLADDDPDDLEAALKSAPSSPPSPVGPA